jgi:hypothetical protein
MYFIVILESIPKPFKAMCVIVFINISGKHKLLFKNGSQVNILTNNFESIFYHGDIL